MKKPFYRHASTICLPGDARKKCLKTSWTGYASSHPYPGKWGRCIKCITKDRKSQYYWIECYNVFEWSMQQLFMCEKCQKQEDGELKM